MGCCQCLYDSCTGALKASPLAQKCVSPLAQKCVSPVCQIPTPLLHSANSHSMKNQVGKKDVLEPFCFITISISQSFYSLCFWQVSKTHNTQLLLQSCVHLCRQTLPHKYQDVEKEEKEGTERKGTCEMEVWQAELEESREDGWMRGERESKLKM